jgi:hypothetical protein
MLLNGVKRPKLPDPNRSPMHHRDTSTGQACPLGIPMYRLQHWAARKKPLQLRTIETTLKALRRRVRTCRTRENFRCHFTVSDPTRSATVHAHAAWRSVPVRRARRLRTCLPHERLSDTARQRQTSHLTTAYRGHAECSTPLGCLCRWHGCMRRCIPLQATRSNIT